MKKIDQKYNLTINDWEFFLKTDLLTKIKNEYKKYHNQILPEYDKIFRAYELTSFKNIKVVILGQDPYPNRSDAVGLAFSVSDKSKIPKSLKNLFLELETDLKIVKENGDLSGWAKQGILLLNTTLIVKENQSNSYQNFGFEEIVEQTFLTLSKKKNIVYILLGKNAQKYSKKISEDNLIIEAPHPSPLSAYRGFFESKLYSRTNYYLQKKGKDKINWEK